MRFKRILSVALSATLMFGTVTFGTFDVSANELSLVGGYNETIYAEWSDSNPQKATVAYKITGDSEYTVLSGDEQTYLQRSKNSSTARVDIPGVPKGTYDVKITASNGTVYEKTDVEVNAQDRSGYAHFDNGKGYDVATNTVGYAEGIGAYNNDGTLKDNAIVLYVTEENKNSVTLTYGGKTVTGIGNILNSRGASSEAKPQNTNNGILSDLSKKNIPLDVRIVGRVEAGNENTKGGTNPMGDATKVPEIDIAGLTGYDSIAYGGSEGDNGYLARITDGSNITIEGIGYDAYVDGWGFHFICSTAGYTNGAGKNFEVKNINFINYPEDAVGLEGQQANGKITAPVRRTWVHNNTFYSGYCESPAESDKAEGDGSCDFKRGYNHTLSYNRFLNCHKTNLVGASDDNLQYDITMHHNYWSDCKARGPLARKANIHLYNNYILRQKDYAENARANAFLFSEYCYFEGCKGSLLPAGGQISSYNDRFVSCAAGDEESCKVQDKNATYSENAKSNFLIDSNLGYIASGQYALDEDANVAKAKCIALSGAMKENLMNYEDIDTSIVSTDAYNAVIANPVAVPYSVNYTDGKAEIGDLAASAGKVVDGIYYSPGKKYKATGGNPMTVTGESIVFYLNQTAVVTMDGVSGSYVPVLYSDDGEIEINCSGTATLKPGVYLVQSSLYDVGTGKFKEARINSLAFEAVTDGEKETVTPVTKLTTEATTNYEQPTETTTAKKDDNNQTTENEESTETTTYNPNGYALMGTYLIGKSVSGDNAYIVSEKDCVVGNIDFQLRAISSGDGSIREEDGSYISFNLEKATKFIVVVSNRAVKLFDNSGNETAVPIGTNTYTLGAGTYTLEGTDSGSNSKISKIVLEETNVLLGDVDENGKVESADAQLLLKYVLGSKTLTSSQLAKADADNSGKVNLIDVVEILNIANA